MFWSAYDGSAVSLDDDPVRAYAQLDFLRRHGYPVFRSDDEIFAYASAHDWPRKSRDTTNSKA